MRRQGLTDPVAWTREADSRRTRYGGAVRLFRALVAFLLLGAATAHGTEPFPEQPDPELQHALEEVIDALGLGAAVRDERLAVSLVRLEEGRPPELAMLNGHHMMYAASLPKIAILYGVAVAVDSGRLELSADMEADVIAMIRNSCNPCATRMLDAVGRDWLLEVLQAEPFRFYDPEKGGGLWVGKAYARGKAYQRDPLHGLSHGATAWQVARWYYLLINGELASPVSTGMMLEALSEPAIRHKFVSGLGDREVTQILRKSGTWRHYHADSALVTAGDSQYILVGMAEDPAGGQWMEALAAAAHDRIAAAAEPRPAE